MSEVAVFLFQHLGVAALVVLFGFLADYVSTSTLKTDVIRWLSQRYRFQISNIKIRRFLQLFLDEYVHRIFGHQIFSWKFFRRTCAATVVTFAAALLVQLILYQPGAPGQFNLFSVNLAVATTMFATAFALNFLIDYISNIQSLSLLRMAALSGKLFDIALIFAIDITLTITLFLFLFPAAITAGLLVSQQLKQNIQIRAELVAEHQISAWDALHRDHIRRWNDALGKQLRYEAIEVSRDLGEEPTSFFLYLAKEADRTDAVHQFTKVLSRVASNIQTFDSDRDYTIKFTPIVPKISGRYVKSLFNATYRWVNAARQDSYDMALLQPSFLPLANIVEEAVDVEYKEGVLLCSTGEVQEVSSIDNFKPSCDVRAIIPAVSFSSMSQFVQQTAFEGNFFPITPFFITSFAVSIAYYMIIIIFMTGMIVLRITQPIFRSPYLNIKERPFTIASLLSLPVFLIIGHTIKLATSG